MDLKTLKKIFVNVRGEMRLGWLLAAAAVMYVVAAVGVYEGYWYLYRTMMNIWCVTGENISRAPGAVRFMYSWSNVIVLLLQNALLIGLAGVLSRMAGLKGEKFGSKRGALKGSGIGAGCVAAVWCVLMLSGSVRMGWRLSRPAFSVSTLALLITTFAVAAAEGLFLYGTVYGMIKKRLPMWAALLGAMVLNVLHMGGMAPAAILNGMLSALVCCALIDREGLAAVIGFRFAWSYLDQAVFGFAGAAAALYETYPVNLYWLSGGNAGIMNGIITSAALIASICLVIGQEGIVNFPKWNKRSKSPS